MIIRTFSAAVVFSCGLLALAAQAQSTGAMSSPMSGTGTMQSHTMSGPSHQNCTNGSSQMASGNHMSGGMMSGGNQMSANNHMNGAMGCRPAKPAKPN